MNLPCVTDATKRADASQTAPRMKRTLVNRQGQSTQRRPGQTSGRMPNSNGSNGRKVSGLSGVEASSGALATLLHKMETESNDGRQEPEILSENFSLCP